ncbi:hypothetical protein DPMN_028013 [Dreissena polymorpha]|uniref:Uncharacterized protein n=1 Tax=Dreissena polymorpha TaxID=45954 RepID=A0A9D4LTY0_DREPO|nr:hypothetical protein DPMN_028013 [Dreissena polymorpha]
MKEVIIYFKVLEVSIEVFIAMAEVRVLKTVVKARVLEAVAEVHIMIHLLVKTARNFTQKSNRFCCWPNRGW